MSAPATDRVEAAASPADASAGQQVRRSALLELASALRVHQWTKNLLLGVPLVMSHRVLDPASLLAVGLGIIAFSLVASAGYLFNDLRDLASDRRHAHKRTRPLAAGRLSIGAAVGWMLALLAGGITLGLLAISWHFAALVGGYVVLAVAYSLYFKRKQVVDVIMLAGFYTYRVLLGAAAIAVVVTPWLLAFSTFFFLSLAMAKRYADLEHTRSAGQQVDDGRAYTAGDMHMLGIMGPAAGYLAVLVFAFYIDSNQVATHYVNPWPLWFICPVLLYWITRLWLITARGEMSHDPVLFAIRDLASYLCGFITAALLVLATVDLDKLNFF